MCLIFLEGSKLLVPDKFEYTHKGDSANYICTALVLIEELLSVPQESSGKAEQTLSIVIYCDRSSLCQGTHSTVNCFKRKFAHF